MSQDNIQTQISESELALSEGSIQSFFLNLSLSRPSISPHLAENDSFMDPLAGVTVDNLGEEESYLTDHGYNMNDSFLSQSILGLVSEEERQEEGADISKLKETNYNQTKVTLTNKILNCAICIEDIVVGNKIIKLQCGHVFHSPCILKWVKDKNSCPYCRKKVTV